MYGALRRLSGLLILGGLSAASMHGLHSCERPAVALGRPETRPSDPPPVEKIVLGLDVPPIRTVLSISADGKFAYLPYGAAYYVFNDNGDLVRRIPIKGSGRGLVPLSNGRYISAESGPAGHVSLLGPDGVELSTLVAQGAPPEKLRHDMTGWTSPTGIAIDPTHNLMFVLDTSLASAGAPDPQWSRIAVFDLNGKYLRELAAYDNRTMPAGDEHRSWYDDIEVDTKRSLVYVTARASQQLLAFDYDGNARGRAPGVSGIAVLPDSSVAVGDPDKRHVRIYDSGLKLTRTLAAEGVADLEVDGAGRLYATIADPTVLYLRWPENFSEPQAVRPLFQKISVEIPFDSAVEGAPLKIYPSISARPSLPDDAWRVFARPSDGSDLLWRELEASYSGGTLTVKPALGLLGLQDIAVHYGKGVISGSELARDLHIEKSITFKKAAETGSVSIRSTTNRSGFRQGEAIAFRLATNGSAVGASPIVTLRRGATVLASSNAPAEHGNYWEIPDTVTRRLLPGHYTLEAALKGATAHGFEFDLAMAEADSPLQRILYHEFDLNPASEAQAKPLAAPERLAFIRDYVDAVADQGFTRETDRAAMMLANAPYAGFWQTSKNIASTDHDSVPQPGTTWEPESYLDRATARGVRYDTQLLTHCSSVLLGDAEFPTPKQTLQRFSQWFGRYPAFYGFNYNDEMFFDNVPFGSMPPESKAWLAAEGARLGGHPTADVYRAGLTRMYREFDHAVQEIRPDLARTATPMWQYPAEEGSYAPTVYAHMTESYSHYLSEGYDWPWYPAHSVDMLRRPGLPLMGVFDGGQRTDGESYLKDSLQVLGRGVQGVGIEHARPFVEARGANALRVMNRLAAMYGPIFAEAKPDNEAAVLYSYAQDITEKRDLMGTPHWERVLALYGAGLMAGLPMSVVYEEDVQAGALLEHGKPKVPLLFLVGQSAALPGAVGDAVRAYTAAGGHVVVDADSRAIPGAIRFPTTLLGPADATRKSLNGDALFPASQPAYTAIAASLKAQFGATRRFPVDTSDPWVSKNRFDGGAVHYVLISSETSPFPWDPGTVWGLGAIFNRSYQPKRVNLTLPTAPVIYDVFERQLVQPTVHGAFETISADLRTFPGRLYALAPRALPAPTLSAQLDSQNIKYSINVGLLARVPVQISLLDAHGAVLTEFRGTDLQGKFSAVIPRPITPESLQLEVSELLGGASSSLTIPAAEPPTALVTALPEVEIEREPAVRGLLAKGPRALNVTGIELLAADLRASLLRALQATGAHVTLTTGELGAPAPGARVVLATTNGKGLGELLQSANLRGLFEHKLGDVYPGARRGFVGAAFATRVYGENAVAVVGGDQEGLNAAVRRLISILDGSYTHSLSAAAAERPGLGALVTGNPAAVANIPKLSTEVGVRLSGVKASGRNLVVSASGYLGNLARVDDRGDHGELIAVARVGESPKTTSLFVSSDGKSYGVAARTVQRFGEGFSLLGAATPPEVFSSFGDAAPFQHAFSVSADATTVLAPGPYGVVAWQRRGATWREAWAEDYWKKFDELDWPVAGDAARIPSFDTLVPEHGDTALIAFGEFTNNNWIQNQASASAEVSARSLSTGAIRWTFRPPIERTLVFPTLYANGDGSLVVLQAQLGAWGKASYRYYALQNGHPIGSWTSEDGALSIAVSERTNRVALGYGGGSRLLEVRLADGTLVFSQTWRTQPLALIFSEDGASVFVSDEAGLLSRLDAHGNLVWQTALGCSAELIRSDTSLYAAGWDGRLRALTLEGKERWKLDLTEPMANAAPTPKGSPLHEPERPAQASARVPTGANFLATKQAVLTVGGTSGWGSVGQVQVPAAALTNGVVDDVTSPWIPNEELFWDGIAARKVWAEIDFKQPTDVHSLTVHENGRFPDSWPTESSIQFWDAEGARWRTAKHAAFLHGPINTYALDLKRVTKLRYVPWSSSFRNFYTSEIEVR